MQMAHDGSPLCESDGSPKNVMARVVQIDDVVPLSQTPTHTAQHPQTARDWGLAIETQVRRPLDRPAEPGVRREEVAALRVHEVDHVAPLRELATDFEHRARDTSPMRSRALVG